MIGAVLPLARVFPVALCRLLHLPWLIHLLLQFTSLPELLLLLLGTSLINLPLLLTHLALPVEHLLLLKFALLLHSAIYVELPLLLELPFSLPILAFSLTLLSLLALPFIHSFQLMLGFPGLAGRLPRLVWEGS